MQKLEGLSILLLVFTVLTSLFISVSSYIIQKQQEDKIDDIIKKVSSIETSLSGLSIDAAILECNN